MFKLVLRMGSSVFVILKSFMASYLNEILNNTKYTS
jgi:hypothetical protein